jgi:hypothetical protein
MAASGEIPWPPMGSFPWPPSKLFLHGVELTLHDDQRPASWLALHRASCH